MANTPYYTGDTVPLKFKVLDGINPVTPSLAKVTVFPPSQTPFEEAEAGIDENVVSYDVPPANTEVYGKYTAYFVLTLPNSVIRTHKMEFEVTQNPG